MDGGRVGEREVSRGGKWLAVRRCREEAARKRLTRDPLSSHEPKTDAQQTAHGTDGVSLRLEGGLSRWPLCTQTKRSLYKPDKGRLVVYPSRHITRLHGADATTIPGVRDLGP